MVLKFVKKTELQNESCALKALDYHKCTMIPTFNKHDTCDYRITISFVDSTLDKKWGTDDLEFTNTCIEECTFQKQTDCCSTNHMTKHIVFYDEFGNAHVLTNDKDSEKARGIIRKQKDQISNIIIDIDNANTERDLNNDEQSLLKIYKQQKHLIPKKAICDENKKCFTVKDEDFYIGNNFLSKNYL